MSQPNNNNKAANPKEWWRTAVTYQVYVRSFKDTNDDGIGDIKGITESIPYLASLGVDAIWLTPFYTSPQADAGYDISNYRDVDAQYGTLADFDALVARAHKFGLKLIIDIVPNHTSTQHPWFKAALKAAPGSRKRQRYLFMDGKGANNELPPNNWESWFDGSAWKRVPNDKQWYLHTFSDQQPDLNWRNPEVRQEFISILKFWLDRGVDGFRLDAVACLIKRKDFGDLQPTDMDDPLSDQPEVFEIYQEWRKLIDGYKGRCLIGEAFADSPRQNLRYVYEGKLHQVFCFDYQSVYWYKANVQSVIRQWTQLTASINTEPVWVTSSHDQIRHISRLGLIIPGLAPSGLDVTCEQPSYEVGVQRSRAMACMTMFLPGALCLYYGEELGLPEHTTLEDRFRQDPSFRPNEFIGRDGCRIPMPWKQKKPAFGFSHRTRTWLPQPSYYGKFAVDVQSGQPDSMLSLYKTLLRLRRRYRLGQNKLEWIASPRTDVMTVKSGDLVLVINFGYSPVVLNVKGELIAKSQPAITLKNNRLPGSAAVWIKVT